METLRTKLLVPVAGTRALAQLCSIFLIFAALSNRLAFAQATAHPLPSCGQAPNTNASISSIGAPGTLTLRPFLEGGRVTAIGHVYVRNDAGFPLSQWCLRGYFLDYLDRPQEVKLSLNGIQQSTEKVCVAVTVASGVIQDLVLSVEVDRDSLPLSGFITLQANGIAEIDQSAEAKKRKINANRDSRVAGNLKPDKCLANSKEVSQNVVLTSTQSASRAGEIILAPAFIGGVFLVSCLWRFRSKLREPMGASQWTFSASVATNLTFVGSLLGTVLASSALPDFPHHMTKQSFIVLGLMFAVLAGLSPILYNFCCKPVGPNSTNPTVLDFEGWVWLFLFADAITIWAVCGQLMTLGLLFNEFVVRQIISSVSAGCAWFIAVAVGVALLVYCYRTARFYVEEHPARNIGELKESKEFALAPTMKKPAPRWTAL